MKQFSDLPDGAVSVVLPEADAKPVFSDLPAGTSLVSEEQPRATFDDIPPGSAMVEVPAPPPQPAASAPPVASPRQQISPAASGEAATSPGYWKRLANSFYVGGADYAANLIGGTLLAGGPDPEETNRKLAAEGSGVLEVMNKPGLGRPFTASEAQAIRRGIKDKLVPDEWRATFQAEQGKQIPNPWDDPIQFLDRVTQQAAANAGNVIAATIGKSPAGKALAAFEMADQEAANYADNWSAAGLPIEFVAPYAKTYGLMAAPVEYAQNMAYAGRGGAAKLLGQRGSAAVRKAVSTTAMRAVMKALDIGLEGAEEAGQTAIEYAVARKMVAKWNEANPDRALDMPELTAAELKQAALAGAGMGVIFEAARGATGLARTTLDRTQAARAARLERIAAGTVLEGAAAGAAAAEAQGQPEAPPPPAAPVAPPNAPVTADPGQPSAAGNKISVKVERIMAPIEPVQIDPEDGAQIAAVQKTGAIVNDFPLDKVNFDPGRFQYKLGSGAEGQTGSLKGVKRYDKMLGGVLSVWYDADKGRVFVVNGHNRGTKAKELGETAHAVRFIDAPDAQTARAAGALMNIAEGAGTAIDAAKFFRDSGYTPAEIDARGLPMSGAVVRKGAALAALPSKLFDQVVQGEMEEPLGVAIGGSGLNQAQQLALGGLVERAGNKLDAQAVAELADDVRDAPTVTKAEGPMLFELSALQENLAVERARVASAINKRLSADQRLFAKVATKKAAARLTAAGNQIDTETNRAVSEDAAVVKEVFNRLKKTADIATVLNAAAEEVYRGKRLSKAVDAAYEGIRAAVSEAIGRTAGGLVAGVEEGARAGGVIAPASGAEGAAQAGRDPAVAQPAAGARAANVAPAAGEMFPGQDLGFELRGQVQPAGQTFQEQQAAAAAKADQDRMQGALPGLTIAGYGGGTSAGARGGTIAEGPRIERLGEMTVPTDDPRYTRLPVGFTDGVRFLKQLGAKIKLSGGRGQWAGMFRGQEQRGRPGPMEILLRHDLFKLVSDKRVAELRAAARAEVEANPLADAMTPAAKQGLEDQVFGESYERERGNAMKRGSPELLAVTWHEIGHLVDFYPDATLKRGNLLGHIKAVRNYTLSMIEGISARGALLEKREKAKLMRAAQRAAGPRPKADADLADWRARAAAEYKRALRAEAEARGLLTLEELDAESKDAIAWWNGKPEMPGYFRDAKERYAEMVSILVNNPRETERRAPKFWKAWNEHLALRPDVSRAWDQLQVEVANGGGVAATEAELRQMVADADRNQYEAFLRQRTNRFRTAVDMLMYSGLRTQAPIDWAILTAEDRAMKAAGVPLWRRWAPGSPALVAAAEAAGTAQVTEALDNWRYATAKAEPYYQDMTRLIGRLQQDGLVNDFRLYMTLRHVSENRQDIGNVKGVDPARADEVLTAMRQRNPDQMEKLDQAHEEWYGIRRRHMINLVEQMGMFNQDQLGVLKRRESYVTFMPDFGTISNNDPKGLIHEMEQSFGREASGSLGFQRGWIGDITDSIAATIQKDRKMIRAAMRNEAAREMAEWLTRWQAANPGGRPLIAEARVSWDSGKKSTVRIGNDNRNLGDLMYLQNGELKHFYVPKAYADFLNGSPPGQAENMLNFMHAHSLGILKRAYVEWAPGAWAVLGLKDLHAYLVQTPGVRADLKLRAIGPAFRAARTIAAGEPDAIGRAGQERTMIGSRLERNDDWGPSEGALQRELDQFGRKVVLSETAAEADRKNFFKEFGRRYMDWANRNNRIWANTLKLAGMTYMDERYPQMPEWKKREIVRVTAGNPDFWHRSGAASLLDWYQLYYNAAKEGRMAALKSVRENPGSYLVNTLIWTAGPAVLMGMFSAGRVTKVLAGLFDPEEEEELAEMEEMMKWIPSYEKERNIVVPLRWEDKTNRRVLYVRLPVSEGQQWAHGLAYAAAARVDPDARSILMGTGMLDMQPGNPLNSIAGAWLDFWRGRNPYDVYRGANVLTDDETAAGGRYAYKKLATFTYNNLLSAMLGRIPSEGAYSPRRGALEKTITAPVVGGLLGRWVRVSSGFDEEEKLIADTVDRPMALARLAAQRAVKDYISTGTWNQARLKDATETAYGVEYMQRFAKEYNLRQTLPPEIERIVFAPSRDFKIEAARRLSGAR